jgi:hypothetical protein
MMGKVWSVDAIAKNQSTDFYGQLVSIAESYFDENNLVVGTDDGLIHLTKDGGKTWTKIDNIPGVPKNTYVNQIIASKHDKNVFYAVFNHHRYGDFKPYIFKSTDGGKTWLPKQGDLPARGSVYSIAEDHINANLLFAGTEFGIYFSIDGGNQWLQLKGGLPTIAIRDIAIQQRENDIVLATFGRGFYILDDYSILRNISAEALQKEALILPIKDALMYNEWRKWGSPLKGFQGESFFATPNPAVGAVFTYYLKDDVKTIKEKRQSAEKEKIKKGLPVYYPSIDSLRLEDTQPEPYLLFTITDESNAVVRKIKAPAKKGLNRIVWDLRYASVGPVNFHIPDPSNPYDQLENGYLAMPGMYKVSLSKFEDGIITELVPPVSFNTKSLYSDALAMAEKKQLTEFCKKVSDLRRALGAADNYKNELSNKMKFIKAAIIEAPQKLESLPAQLVSIDQKLININTQLNGDNTLAKREFETLPSINGRVGSIEYTLWNVSAAPTQTFIKSYEIAHEQFTAVLALLKEVDESIKKVEDILDQSNAPYTPGRIPSQKGK